MKKIIRISIKLLMVLAAIAGCKEDDDLFYNQTPEDTTQSGWCWNKYPKDDFCPVNHPNETKGAEEYGCKPGPTGTVKIINHDQQSKKSILK